MADFDPSLARLARKLSEASDPPPWNAPELALLVARIDAALLARRRADDIQGRLKR